jgi:DHA1 family bicyclomycin/chloramphenicol resistance-like MFS transporter
MLTLPATMVLFFLFLSCVGLTYPNSAAIAMAPYAAHAGRASALLGFLQTGLGAIVSAGLGALGAKAVPALLAGSAVAGLLSLLAGAPFIGALVEGDDSVVIVH